MYNHTQLLKNLAKHLTLVHLLLYSLFFQLCVLGQSWVLDDGKTFSTSGPFNIYLPYLNLLDQTTVQMGNNKLFDTFMQLNQDKVSLTTLLTNSLSQ